MLKRTAALVSACSLLGTLSGCGSTDSGDDNAAPKIDDLSADRDGVVVQIGTANLTVQASDDDGDPLEYSWSVDFGTVTPGADAGTALLTAPPDRGMATVTVTVTDGNGGEAQESIDLGVVGWVVPESAATVPAGTSFNAIHFSDSENGVAVGGSHEVNVPAIYRYVSGTWIDDTAGLAGHLQTAVVNAPNDIWTAGGGGLGFHYNGSEWAQFSIPGGCVHGMDFISATDGWVTPAEGQPYMRRWTGGMVNEWQQYTAPSTSGLNGVHMATDSDGWAVGNGGTALRFDGDSWQEVDTGSVAALKAVGMIAADDGWAVGNGGAALHWDGAAWTAIPTPSAANLNGVYALATDDVWAVGAQGTIIHWDGAAWTQLPSPVTSDLVWVHFTSASEGWIAGFESALLHLE